MLCLHCLPLWRVVLPCYFVWRRILLMVNVMLEVVWVCGDDWLMNWWIDNDNSYSYSNDIGITFFNTSAIKDVRVLCTCIYLFNSSFQHFTESSNTELWTEKNISWKNQANIDLYVSFFQYSFHVFMYSCIYSIIQSINHLTNQPTHDKNENENKYLNYSNSPC